MEFPGNTVALEGVGAQMITPLLRDGAPIGTLALHRGEIRPFSDREVRLAETFADFRQFSGPENDQDDDQNQDEFCNAH